AIEKWRRKAFEYSYSDRMGNLLTRVFEVMLAVVENGDRSDNIEYAVESLTREREHAMRNDKMKDQPLNDFIYGICECLGVTASSIIERKVEEPVAEETEANGVCEEEIQNELQEQNDTSSNTNTTSSPAPTRTDTNEPALQLQIQEQPTSSDAAETASTVSPTVVDNANQMIIPTARSQLRKRKSDVFYGEEDNADREESAAAVAAAAAPAASSAPAAAA
ncbi:hypothetical protein PFISCL1PPCAC_23801, partial [Pristionchus fissidentatus]